MKRIVVALAFMLGLLAVAATAQSTGYTDWSAPVKLPPPVNSPYLDSCVTVSKNGLSMYFGSTRWASGGGTWHLYVSKRATVNDPWGEPQDLHVLVGFNDGYGFTCPKLSLDEHRLFFASSRPGTCGAYDLWVSRRDDRMDDLGWQSPVNLGCEPNGPNSPQWEQMPTVFEDETGTEVLYFNSSRPGFPGVYVWQSRMRNDGTFGPATPVTGLTNCVGPAARRDGLELIVNCGGDLWTATRASTTDPWSALVPLPMLNSPYGEGGVMSFSFDGRQLYFMSDRDRLPPPGTAYQSRDLYVATREKLRQ